MLKLSRLQSNHIDIDTRFLSRELCDVLGRDDRQMAEIIHTLGPSEVAPSVSGKYIIKLVTCRTFHERIKALWMRSRLSKEVRGNELMRSVGIRVPEIKESGYHPFPVTTKRFLGYYIMENMTREGFVELGEVLKDDDFDASMGKLVLQNVIRDIRSMADHSIVFSDLHLGNILINKQGDTAWIDTGVTHYSFGRGYKFPRKFNDSIKRLLKQPLLNRLADTARQEIEALMITGLDKKTDVVPSQQVS